MTGGIFSRTELEMAPRPTPRLPLCGACGLYKGCISPKMPVAGKGAKGIMVVGEAPGANEDREGKPFVGESGQMLQKALRAVGVELFRDCWVTNALSCRPEDNKIDDKKSIEYCRPLVKSAIEKHRPTVILLVGKSAVESVIRPLFGQDVDYLGRWVGQRIPNLLHNAWLCPTFHPSYLMRDRGEAPKSLFQAHVAEACKRAGKRPWKDAPAKQDGYDLVCETIVDPAEASERLETLDFDRGIAFDFETFCLRSQSPDAGILCCSASDGKRSVAFPWTGKAAKTMTSILLDETVDKFAQNLKFEDGWCRTILGIEVAWGEGFWDCMLGSHLLDPRTGTSGLDFQAFAKLGVRNYWSKVVPFMEGNKVKYGANAPNKLKQANLASVLHYNALDSLYEHILSTRQMKELGYG